MEISPPLHMGVIRLSGRVTAEIIIFSTLVFVYSLLLYATPVCAQKDISALYKKVAPSVVRIAVLNTEGKLKSGTGFFIREIGALGWFEKGSALLTAKRYQEAIDAFTRAIELNPNYAGPYASRGFAYIIKGQHDRAIEDFTKAISLNPNNWVDYHERGFAYYYLGRYHRALNDSNKVIEMNPKGIDEYCFRGLIYARLGDYQKATNDLNKAISMDSDNMSVYYNMGCFYSIQNKPDQACFYLKKAIEKGFKDWDWIKKDIDFDNIRNEECYRQIMRGK